MKSLVKIIGVIAVFGLTLVVHADVLTLKNGNMLHGTFIGSDGKTIQFKGDLGTLSVEKANIVSISFGAPGTVAPAAAPAPATPAPAASPAPAVAPAQPQSVTIPAGTKLFVRMTSSVSSRNRVGTPFSTVLFMDVQVGGKPALKTGQKIMGRVADAREPRIGPTTLDIRLSQLQLGSQQVTLASSPYREANNSSMQQAARGAAAGAAIGAIADGGDGAAKGAAAGAAAGVLHKGKTITISPGTILEFSLIQPVTVQVTE